MTVMIHRAENAGWGGGLPGDGLSERESAAIQVVFALIELIEAGGGFVDLQGLFVLRAVHGAGKVPIGVEEIGGCAFDSFEAEPLGSIATRAD
jgi:hypothetical protein